MFFYARADTHFLLYIFDHMRNELIDGSHPDSSGQNSMETVLQQSKETSLLRYERAVYNAESGRGPGGWYSMLLKHTSLLNNEQFSIFRAVHEWRDKIARIDDDSPVFVMPPHVLMNIAKLMPMDMVALLGIAHPVSHGVKSRAGELLSLVKTAKSRGNSGPSMMDVLRPDSTSYVTKSKIAVPATTTTVESMVAIVDQSELRSNDSAFWGGAFGSSVWDAPTLVKNEHLRLAVPLPALSSEIFAPSNGFAPLSKVSTPQSKVPEEDMISVSITPTPTPIRKQPSIEEQAFVLKRGAKRKSDVVSDVDDSDMEEPEAKISLNTEAEQVAREKAARKRERKERKQEKKAAKKAALVEAGTVDEEEVSDEPFDYSKAESVLNSKRKDENKGGKGKKQPFDPYQKSSDAPKGMRRAQTERPGKSHTFKN
jgi:exosome complex exonuclease RRP6